MKKIICTILSIAILTACKKATTTPINSNTNPTDTSISKVDTNKYVTNDIVSIGKPIGKIGSSVTDIDGNKYRTIIIGNQEWMGENLRVSKYNNGSLILNLTDNNQWKNNKTGATSCINNLTNNDLKYGKLYNWYALNPITNGNKNVCPNGWRIPSKSDFQNLINTLGGDTLAGRHLKEVGDSNWNGKNNSATNKSLLTAIPTLFRTDQGDFSSNNQTDNYLSWWNSDFGINDVNQEWAGYLRIYAKSYYGKANLNGMSKNFGFSVRCLKN